MRSALNTDKAPIDWEPCKVCGDRLDFQTTDGLGRIIPKCPHCDWGWPLSREYTAFAIRKERAEKQQVTLARFCHCGALFDGDGTRQKYCSDKCRQAADRARMKTWRHTMAVCADCGEPIISFSGKRLYCDSCGQERTLAARKKYRAQQRKRVAA